MLLGKQKITLSVIFSTSMCRGHGVYFLTIHSFLVFSAICCKGEKRTKKSFLSFWNCRNIQAGNNKSMEQYYIATEDGKTEGPYSFESLETFYTHGKIRIDTLVCIAGSQEWMEFKKVLEQERKVQSEKEQEQTEATPTDVELIPTVEGLFQIMGILALLAGVILALCNTGPGYAAIGIIYLLSGAFFCLGCFWCAKVIKLLSRVVDLLSTIAKRLYNVGNKD